MKTSPKSAFAPRRRFRIVFWLCLAVFTLGYITSLFTGAPSNVVYQGVEITGYARFVVNLIFIPIFSLLLGALSVLPEMAWNFIKRLFQKDET